MKVSKADEKLIDLKELCSILLIKGIAGAKKWCEEVNIKIHTIGNKNVVHRFLVEIELDKQLINELKRKYPHKWDTLYQCYQENDKLGYLQHLAEDKINVGYSSVSRREKRSNLADKLENL
ncbi:hypothetical protein [Kordia sp.]|uniref:hypothetical protein n=1 Tax=Kordia sp. TaxID=1965332 RepID=UPI003D2D9E58